MDEGRSHAVLIEAALNGGRDRAQQPAVPYSAGELAAEARRCADAGATLFHVHARGADGGWTADPARYAEVIVALRAVVPDGLVSIASLRPEGVPVETLLELLSSLAADDGTKPELISINLGHITAWEEGGEVGRRTVHYPNAYEDIRRLLAACRGYGICPELGIMDLGFVSNAVTLHEDGVLPTDPWFLLELDSPAYGAGVQGAPATAANYHALAAPMREHFPLARWAAHGQGVAGYAVIERALVEGAHIRVGFEDAVHLSDGRLAGSNADLVSWGAAAARSVGREPATIVQARVITGCH